jgi:hypothetical protein
MANYSSDEDLVALRPDILNLGVDEWTAKHTEAASIINRVVEYKWYRGEAQENGVDWRSSPFDSSLLLSADTQLKRLSSYKTLELIYEYIMQASADPSAFSSLRDLYAKKYSEELKDVLGAGLDYDWTSSGAISYEEKAAPAIRRLKRM